MTAAARSATPTNRQVGAYSKRSRATNLPGKRIADLDRRGVAWKKFYNVNMPARLPQNRGPDGLFTAAKWEPLDSGLIGPVTLTPLTPAR